MGGGGFTMEPENPALDDYVRTLAPAREPRICLLPTAGGDSEDQIRRFHTAFSDKLCEPTHISLFRLGTHPVPLREHLLAQDIIYVGGGSMINLLALWRAHGLDEILREAWQSGIVLAGLSAGSMCWFEWGVTKSVGAPMPARGLGFLPGSNSVHYDGEPERRPVYLSSVASGAIPPGWAVDDGAGLLFRGARRGGGRGLAARRARVPGAGRGRRGGRGGHRAAAAQGAGARGPDGAAGGRGAAGAARRAARPPAGLTRGRDERRHRLGRADVSAGGGRTSIPLSVATVDAQRGIELAAASDPLPTQPPLTLAAAAPTGRMSAWPRRSAPAR